MNVGDIDIDFLGHSGFMLKLKNKNIIVDPYRTSDNLPKADIILITHSHYDHCSIKDIQKLSKPGTLALCPVDCQSTLMKIKNLDLHIVESEDVLDFNSFKIECVPAYTNNKHHPKNEGWLGYVIKFGKNIVYFAGHTDNVPEIHRLSGYGKNGNKFITILPIAGEAAMDVASAADVASTLNSSLAIPMSYGSGTYGTVNDAKIFVELCLQKGINAQILNKL